MAIENRKNLDSDPKLIINLKELFGVDSFPDDEGLKQEIADTIIDELKERSADGYDKDGKKFKPYSKDYINSLDFKAFGKSASNVNLRLSGDMIEDLTLLDSSSNTITIGFASEDSAAKASGHITGAVGVTRDFFGLRTTDYTKIRDMYDLDTAAASINEETVPSIIGQTMIRLGDLLGAIPRDE